MMENYITENEAAQKTANVAPSPECAGEGLRDGMFEYLMARHEMTENYYKKLEELLPCEPMSDEMLAAMNKSMGFKGEAAKTRDYRPYCGQEVCEMNPRMMRVKEGFRCWDCYGIWDLRKVGE